MTTTVCITGYKYEELDQKAKDRVGQWLNDGEEPWEDDKEYWLEELAALGYEGVDFQYSGFYSQGDGGSITCTVNAEKFLLRNKLGNKYRSLLYWLRTGDISGGIDVTRERWGNYVHQHLLRANADNMVFDLFTFPQIKDYGLLHDHPVIGQAKEVAQLALEEVKEWSVKIYDSLKNQWEYQFTDEYMIDMCDANEYLFDKTGKPVHHLKIAA